MIAPGISPNQVYTITKKSLTSAYPYANKSLNPHLDPISPKSPILVYDFACDLLNTAAESRGAKLKDPFCFNPYAGVTANDYSKAWKIAADLPGLVLLSDPTVDKYVNAIDTDAVIKNQSHFTEISYAQTKHEIDNEIPSARKKALDDIAAFLLRTDQ